MPVLTLRSKISAVTSMSSSRLITTHCACTRLFTTARRWSSSESTRPHNRGGLLRWSSSRAKKRAFRPAPGLEFYQASGDLSSDVLSSQKAGPRYRLPLVGIGSGSSLRREVHSDTHRLDESPAGYSLTGCSPAEPASAYPAFSSLS